MGKEASLKFKGDEQKLRHKISHYIYSGDSRYDEITLNYLGKWIWIYTYNEGEEILLDINFSKDFVDKEIQNFISEMNTLGLFNT